MIELLLPAFAVSVVLLGIHSWFGLRIIERGIIFTDLAIGQCAALGASVSLLWWNGDGIYFTSLACALAGGLFIAWATRRARSPEAVIGLVWALGIAGVFLVLSRSAHGTEEMSALLAYDILFTPLADVWPVALLYAALGGGLWFSERHARGATRDIVFFVLFAATVTSSVKLAGVLVVFAILLAPAYVALLVVAMKKVPVRVRRSPLGLSWVIGIVVNIGALLGSYALDLPTGYSLVFVHAAVALGAAVLLHERRSG